uniref:Uncharacterized protein n=1 Tax=Anguilla anguilla TaxID=7936 RepID=A0A0E9TYZ3_ANGAN
MNTSRFEKVVSLPMVSLPLKLQSRSRSECKAER